MELLSIVALHEGLNQNMASIKLPLNSIIDNPIESVMVIMLLQKNMLDMLS